MKAKELMIGDWVRIDEPDKYAGATGQIQSLMYHREDDASYFNVFIQGKFGYVSRDVCSDDIRHIPLTAEILEKNGFENIGDDTFQLEEKPCWFWVDFFRHTYGCEYDTSTYEYEDDEHRLKLYGIPSVHELQHALRLCGIEKEIEL